jgi:hypothetical protein
VGDWFANDRFVKDRTGTGMLTFGSDMGVVRQPCRPASRLLVPKRAKQGTERLSNSLTKTAAAFAAVGFER